MDKTIITLNPPLYGWRGGDTYDIVAAEFTEGFSEPTAYYVIGGHYSPNTLQRVVQGSADFPSFVRSKQLA